MQMRRWQSNRRNTVQTSTPSMKLTRTNTSHNQRKSMLQSTKQTTQTQYVNTTENGTMNTTNPTNIRKRGYNAQRISPVKLHVHGLEFHNGDDLILNPEYFPELKDIDRDEYVVELYHLEDEHENFVDTLQSTYSTLNRDTNSSTSPSKRHRQVKPVHHHLLLEVPETTKFQKKAKMLQVSVLRDIATYFNLSAFNDVVVQFVPKSDVELDFVEISMKDQFLSRRDLWYLKKSLVGKALYAGKKLRVQSTRWHVVECRVGRVRVRSGVVSPRTKLAFRSKTTRVMWLVQISPEMWEFANSGHLYLELFLGVVKSVMEKWIRHDVSHSITIIFFARNYYPELDESNTNTFKGSMSNFNLGDSQTIGLLPFDIRNKGQATIEVDEDGRHYEDFYKIVTFDAEVKELQPLILKLKQEIIDFPFSCGWKSPNAETVQMTSLRSNCQCQIANGKESLKKRLGTPSSARNGNLLEAINLVLNIFEKHHIDRDLNQSGQSVVLITAGNGIFSVNRKLSEITEQRMMDHGIGIDLISLSTRPMHPVPLFLFDRKFNGHGNYGSTGIPNWIPLSYIHEDIMNEHKCPLDMDISQSCSICCPARKTVDDEFHPLPMTLMFKNEFDEHLMNTIVESTVRFFPRPLEFLLTNQNCTKCTKCKNSNYEQSYTDEMLGDNITSQGMRIRTQSIEANLCKNMISMPAANGIPNNWDSNTNYKKIFEKAPPRNESILNFSSIYSATATSDEDYRMLADFDSYDDNVFWIPGLRKPIHSSNSNIDTTSAGQSFGASPPKSMGQNLTPNTSSGVVNVPLVISKSTRKQRGGSASAILKAFNPDNNLPQQLPLSRVNNVNVSRRFPAQQATTNGTNAKLRPRQQSSASILIQDPLHRNSSPGAVPNSPTMSSQMVRSSGSDNTLSDAHTKPAKSAKLLSPHVAPGRNGRERMLSSPSNEDLYGIEISTKRGISDKNDVQSSSLPGPSSHLALQDELDSIRENRGIQRHRERKDFTASSTFHAATSTAIANSLHYHHQSSTVLHGSLNSGGSGNGSSSITSMANIMMDSPPIYSAASVGGTGATISNVPGTLSESIFHSHAYIYKQFTSNQRRWSQLYAYDDEYQLVQSNLKWKSLCFPALLPLTTDYMPSAQELRAHYQLYNYSVALQDRSSHFLPVNNRSNSSSYDAYLALVQEMVAQRFSQDFQLVTLDDSKYAQHSITNVNTGTATGLASSPGKPHLQSSQASAPNIPAEFDITKSASNQIFRLSKGHRIHEIQYSEETQTVNVKRFRLQKTAQLETNEISNYRYSLWSHVTEGFRSASQEFRKYPESEFGWNYLDQLICGDYVEMSEVTMYKRISYCILPPIISGEMMDLPDDGAVGSNTYDVVKVMKQYVEGCKKFLDYLKSKMEKNMIFPEIRIKSVTPDIKSLNTYGNNAFHSNSSQEHIKISLHADENEFQIGANWVVVRMDANLSLTQAFHVEVQWLVCHSSLVDDFTTGIVRRAKQLGLSILQLSNIGISSDLDLHPLFGSIFIPLTGVYKHRLIEQMLAEEFRFCPEGLHLIPRNPKSHREEYAIVENLSDKFISASSSSRRMRKSAYYRQYLHRTLSCFIRFTQTGIVWISIERQNNEECQTIFYAIEKRVDIIRKKERLMAELVSFDSQKSKSQHDVGIMVRKTTFDEVETEPSQETNSSSPLPEPSNHSTYSMETNAIEGYSDKTMSEPLSPEYHDVELSDINVSTLQPDKNLSIISNTPSIVLDETKYQPASMNFEADNL